jgi:4-amino-4-deoxy-L-arabinose transferase-like glycosyltransferase
MAARAPDFGAGAGRRWFLLSSAMLALGTLTKGPVALMLCGAVALFWILSERRARDITRMPWLLATVVYSAIAVPWFALAAHRNGDFLRFFFVHEHVQRYLENTEHGWGPWFFIPVVIGGTWPWFFFAPMGLRDARADDPNESASHRSKVRFLTIWFVAIFVFFSIPRAKLGSYILPALPALSILTGLGMYRLWKIEVGRAPRMIAGFSALTLLGAIGAAIAASALRGKAPHALVADACMIAILVGAIAIGSFIVNRDGKRPGAFVMTLALGMVLVMGVAERARRHGAALTSYRQLANEASMYLLPGCVVGSYRHDLQSLPFYTGYREALVSYRGELAPFSADPDAAASFINSDADLRRLWSSHQCFMLIANRKDLPALENLTPAPVIVGCEGKKLALFNGAGAAPNVDCIASGH